MHFWKVNRIYDNKNFTWGDVTKGYMSVIQKKTLKRFVHDFKGFAKDKTVAKININLGVDEDDTEELLVVAPEGMTNKESLELNRYT